MRFNLRSIPVLAWSVEAIPSLLSPLLRLFRRPTIHRWLSILVLSQFGLVFAGMLYLMLSPLARKAGETLAVVPPYFLALILGAPVALASAPLVRLGGLRWGHFRYLLVYPPTWAAAIFGATEACLLKNWHADLPLPDPDRESLSWSIGIWIVAPFLCLSWASFSSWRSSPRRHPSRADQPSTAEESLRAFADDPEGQLIPWLEQEQPIEYPEDDRFGMRLVARRIAERLLEQRLGTIGMVGPHGSGKSSIVNLVKYYLSSDRDFWSRSFSRWRGRRATWWQRAWSRKPPRVLLCKVNAWGLVDKPGAAVILRQAVEELSRAADSVSVITLPERYVQAFKGVGPTWMNLPLTLSSSEDATEQLRRLEPILDAIDARLVVAIEDLDRNVDGAASGKVSNALRAMLSHLHDAERISFVVSASSRDAIDFARLCEWTEPIGGLDPRLIWKVSSAFRRYCLTWMQECGDVQATPAESLQLMEGGKDIEWAFLADRRIKPVSFVLCQFLSSPRALKHALRRTYSSWSELHGEIDFDDLLVCNVIRMVSPDAFDLLVELQETLSESRRRGEKPDGVGILWESRVQDCSPVERDQLSLLAAFLFPWIKSEVGRRPWSPPQGVARAGYLDRVESGWVAATVRDQQVLRDIVRWKQEASDPTLPGAVASDEEYVGVFARIAEGNPDPVVRLSLNEVCRLATGVFDIGLARLHADAHEGSIAGFGALVLRARKLRGSENPGFSYAEWLWEEIRKALPRSLALANGLEYHWGSVEERLLTGEERKRLREQIIRWAFENLSPATLASNLGRRNPETLYQFARQDQMPEGDSFDPEKWLWLTPRLIDAMTASPSTVAPQACILLTRLKVKPQVDIHQPRSRRGVLLDSLDRELVGELAPEEEQRRRLLELLASAKNLAEGFGPRDRAAVEGVAEEAARWLEESGGRLIDLGAPDVDTLELDREEEGGPPDGDLNGQGSDPHQLQDHAADSPELD